MKPIILIVLCVMLAGCRTGYQKDRTLRVITIFGIGWIFERKGTNKIQVFSIGSLKAVSASTTLQTNAPFVIEP